MKQILYIILLSGALTSAMAQDGSIFPKGEKAPTIIMWEQLT